MPLVVLIADDHFPVRFGLEILVREILGNNTQIDFASDFHEVLNNIEAKRYDILITDIGMPGMDCLTMLKSALKITPNLKVLVVSVHSKELFASRYRKAGASGYVCKGDSDEELKKAIQYIYLGKRYFPEIISEGRFQQSNRKKEDNPVDLLSQREFSVMLLLLEGKDNGSIASTLQLSPSTVSTYRARIFEKLKVKNLVELSTLARLYNIFST